MVSLDILNAQQLLQLDWSTLPSWSIIGLNAVFFLIGLIAHVYKKLHEHKITFKQYWMNDEESSNRSLFGLLFSFASMCLATPNAPLYAFFMTSYIMDSVLNRSSPNEPDIEPQPEDETDIKP